MQDLNNIPRKTALNGVHRAMGARMVDFNGWDMPVEYPSSGGLMAEHLAARTGVGLFDVSHMGEVRLSGPQALGAVQHLTMNDAARVAIGQCQYSAMLYPEGTFVDDLVLHRVGDDDYWIVINAGTREKDWNWIRDNAAGFDCRPEHLSDDYTQIAIQGPKAAELLGRVTGADLAKVKFYWLTHGTVCGLPDTMIARTGYTAEDGFEIYLPPDERTGAEVWNRLLEAGRDLGAVACGLGARNTLRLEGRLPLYGHEISDKITPLEAGLERFLKLDKAEFIGRDALLRQQAEGVKRKLVGLEMTGRGIARDGYPVLDEAGSEIGYVTSGSHAPFLKKNIALAYVPAERAAVGGEVAVAIRGQAVKARVVPTPFYRRAAKA